MINDGVARIGLYIKNGPFNKGYFYPLKMVIGTS